jgi:hypothetical protein
MHSNYDIPFVPGVMFLPQWLGLRVLVSDSSVSNVKFINAVEASFYVSYARNVVALWCDG